MDLYVLTMGAVTIDQMMQIDQQINEIDIKLDPVEYKAMITSRSIISKDFFRVCNELSLSPQARAKLSISAVKSAKESKNPLMDALGL